VRKKGQKGGQPGVSNTKEKTTGKRGKEPGMQKTKKSLRVAGNQHETGGAFVQGENTIRGTQKVGLTSVEKKKRAG